MSFMYMSIIRSIILNKKELIIVTKDEHSAKLLYDRITKDIRNIVSDKEQVVVHGEGKPVSGCECNDCASYRYMYEQAHKDCKCGCHSIGGYRYCASCCLKLKQKKG